MIRTPANGLRYRLSPETVAEATAKMGDHERGALRWLDAYARQHNMSLVQLAPKLKKTNGDTYSDDSIFQALTGVRKGGLGNIADSIIAFKEYVEREDATIKSGFIITSLTLLIWRICQKALRRHRICFIFGRSQVGKSRALQEYAKEHNHGETVYVRMPTGGTISAFIRALAVRLFGRVSENESMPSLRQRIFNKFDDRMLLIVDECHQAIRPDSARVSSIAALEFIRELVEHANCGAVLCGTNVFRDRLRSGRFAGDLEQLWLRRLTALELPDFPAQGQLNQFAKAYGLPPAPEHKIKANFNRASAEDVPRKLQDHTIKTAGLGHWIAILQEAADLAQERKQPVNWAHVIIASAQIAAMSEFHDTELADTQVSNGNPIDV